MQGKEVVTAGGPTSNIQHEVIIQADMSGFRHQITAYIIDMQFDLILGRTWFKLVEPFPAWRTDEWCVKQGLNTYLLQRDRQPLSTTLTEGPIHATGNTEKGEEEDIQECNFLISHRQLRKEESRKDVEELFLVFPRDYVQVKQLSKKCEMDRLVETYQDVFRDELPGIPPDKGVAHAIDTGDHFPISRAPFKMSPAELDKLKNSWRNYKSLD